MTFALLNMVNTSFKVSVYNTVGNGSVVMTAGGYLPHIQIRL
jgi:hypothetical protein